MFFSNSFVLLQVIEVTESPKNNNNAMDSKPKQHYTEMKCSNQIKCIFGCIEIGYMVDVVGFWCDIASYATVSSQEIHCQHCLELQIQIHREREAYSTLTKLVKACTCSLGLPKIKASLQNNGVISAADDYAHAINCYID